MKYTQAVDCLIKKADINRVAAIILGWVAAVIVATAGLSAMYADLSYWIPSGDMATYIFLFGLTIASFGLHFNQESKRLADRAEVYAMFAKKETVDIRLEKILVKVIGYFQDPKKAAIDFDALATFAELDRAQTAFALSASARVEETNAAVLRLCQKLAESDWLAEQLPIEAYVKVGKIRQDAVHNLVASIHNDLDLFLKVINSSPEAGPDVIKLTIALDRIRNQLDPIVSDVNKESSVSVIALRAAERRVAAE